MKNKTFYYRFQKEDGKWAVGQLRFKEFIALLINIRIDKMTDKVLLVESPLVAKAIIAPTMQVIDLNKTHLKIFSTFEDAIKCDNSINMNICSPQYSDYNHRGVFGDTGVTDIWDSLDEKIDIGRCREIGGDWFMNPITYKWDGTQAQFVDVKKNIAYDFINNKCVYIGEDFSLDGCYANKEKCQEDNAVECYTFAD